MKNRLSYTPSLIHKFCVIILLFAFIFTALAQFLHVHNSHNHTESTHYTHFHKHQIGKTATSACQICQFSLNHNNGQILPSLTLFTFKVTTNTTLLHSNYVAFYTQKHLSLFSGSSPPTV
jgi:hypothetical protein